MSRQSVSDALNRPMHDLRISVIDRCNFRCPYCMPKYTIPEDFRFIEKKDWLSFDEILKISKQSNFHKKSKPFTVLFNLRRHTTPSDVVISRPGSSLCEITFEVGNYCKKRHFSVAFFTGRRILYGGVRGRGGGWDVMGALANSTPR